MKCFNLSYTLPSGHEGRSPYMFATSKAKAIDDVIRVQPGAHSFILLSTTEVGLAVTNEAKHYVKHEAARARNAGRLARIETSKVGS